MKLSLQTQLLSRANVCCFYHSLDSKACCWNILIWIKKTAFYLHSYSVKKKENCLSNLCLQICSAQFFFPMYLISLATYLRDKIYLSHWILWLFGFIKMQFLFVKFVSSQFLKWQLWSSVWEEHRTHRGKIILIASYPVTIVFC